MNILPRVIGKIKSIFIDMYCNSQTRDLANRIAESTSRKTLYLFCAPTHSNLGDQAQLFCWLRLFRVWYLDYRIICVPTRYRRLDTLFEIRKKIRKDDLIFIHSGYLIYDPHPELSFVQDVVNAFYDYPVTILPQTVNLIAEWFRHVISQCFNSHPNLTLMCRDEVSLQKAQELFPKVKLRLMPDVVTSLIGDREFQYNLSRNGICFCIRDDGEKYYTDEQLQSLKHRFKHVKIDQCDTTIDAPIKAWEGHREELIRKMLKRFAGYQLIITDRYHGTIFSQIVNTPVVVISSGDHKLSSGVKWFPKDVFSENVFFAKSLNDAYDRAVEILQRGSKVIENPPYFMTNYWNKF